MVVLPTYEIDNISHINLTTLYKIRFLIMVKLICILVIYINIFILQLSGGIYLNP